MSDYADLIARAEASGAGTATEMIAALKAVIAERDAALLEIDRRERGFQARAADIWDPIFKHQQSRAEVAEAENAALRARVLELEDVTAYVLQDDLLNRLTPRVIDIAFSAWSLGRSGKNKEDGGPCDWFNDTRPMAVEKIGEIAAALRAKPAEPQA